MIWEEVITEDPLTVAVYEEDEESGDTWVHIYRSGIRMFEFITPEMAAGIIQEIQELEEERLDLLGEDDGV